GEYGDDPDDPGKDDPFDVAVWRASHGGEPGWASPWGTGRPGWHAECAAMALHAFGPAVDVQAGGGDLAFPHHACQAALAEAFTGVRPFARVRFNTGVVRVAGAKMAKSTGNLVLVSDLLKEYSAAAVRLPGSNASRPRPDGRITVPSAAGLQAVRAGSRRWPPRARPWPATSTSP